MIPGLPIVPGGGGSLSIRYSSNVNDVNLHDDLGSPAGPVDVTVFIDAGVSIGSTDSSIPAFLIENFGDGSRFFIANFGAIAGAGGVGGGGDRGRRDNASSSSFVGGGGGGGAGSNNAAGGVAASALYSATDGSAGNATTGGAGGVNDFGGAIPSGGYTSGSTLGDPGTGFSAYIPLGGTSWDLRFHNAGTIYSGGYGGRGGIQLGGLPGGATDPENGEDLPAFGTVSVTGDPHKAFVATSFVNVYRTGTWTYPSIRGYVSVPTDL